MLRVLTRLVLPTLWCLLFWSRAHRRHRRRRAAPGSGRLGDVLIAVTSVLQSAHEVSFQVRGSDRFHPADVYGSAGRRRPAWARHRSPPRHVWTIRRGDDIWTIQRRLSFRYTPWLTHLVLGEVGVHVPSRRALQGAHALQHPALRPVHATCADTPGSRNGDPVQWCRRRCVGLRGVRLGSG